MNASRSHGIMLSNTSLARDAAFMPHGILPTTPRWCKHNGESLLQHGQPGTEHAHCSQYCPPGMASDLQSCRRWLGCPQWWLHWHLRPLLRLLSGLPSALSVRGRFKGFCFVPDVSLCSEKACNHDLLGGGVARIAGGGKPTSRPRTSGSGTEAQMTLTPPSPPPIVIARAAASSLCRRSSSTAMLLAGKRPWSSQVNT